MRDQDIARFVVDQVGKQARATAAHRHGKVVAAANGLHDVEVDGSTLSGLSSAVGRNYTVGEWVTVARMAGGSQAFQIIGQSAFMGGDV